MAATHSRRAARNIVLRTIALVILALVLGVGIGMLLYPNMPFSRSQNALRGKVTIAEDQLDLTLGSYTHDDRVTDVSVREAIEESSSLEAVRNSDGTFDIPSVDSVLAIARDRILAQDAAERGITASDEDALAYAQQTLGTDDLSVVAASYNMDRDQVIELLRRSAVLAKLRDEVVVTESVSKPEAPAEAGEDEDEATEEYGAYVIELMGDEWDADANTWAREDGPYREALRDYSISNDSATHAAAQAAYYVAYEQYAQTEQQIATEWTTYVNERLSDVTVQLYSLVA